MGAAIHAPDIVETCRRLEEMPAADRVAWAVREHGQGLTFACSFGVEDMVVLDLLLRADPHASVFALDTGRLHQQTYDLMERARRHYGRSFAVYAPNAAALEALVGEHGPNSFYRSVGARKECCRIRKVEPLARALAGRTAWLTGLRRAQAPTRGLLPFAEIDRAHGGIVKLNPLADWEATGVWAYVSSRRLHYNDLHDREFPSIGCVPCTRAVAPGEDIRAGRWWWEAPEHKECGLHVRGQGE